MEFPCNEFYSFPGPAHFSICSSWPHTPMQTGYLRPPSPWTGILSGPPSPKTNQTKTPWKYAEYKTCTAGNDKNGSNEAQEGNKILGVPGGCSALWPEEEGGWCYSEVKHRTLQACFPLPGTTALASDWRPTLGSHADSGRPHWGTEMGKSTGEDWLASDSLFSVPHLPTGISGIHSSFKYIPPWWFDGETGRASWWGEMKWGLLILFFQPGDFHPRTHPSLNS